MSWWRAVARGSIWSLAIQMLEGLKYIHDHGILHRGASLRRLNNMTDLKTANCFLTSSGALKIGDLNVSRLMKQGLVRTQIGTPYYMSPEIWEGKAYDSKSDMWSVRRCGGTGRRLCSRYPPRDVHALM